MIVLVACLLLRIMGDIGIAHDVCGDGQLLWYRVTLSDGSNMVKVHGTAEQVLLRCIATLNHIHAWSALPPEVADKMTGAPYPGAYQQCTP